MGSRPEKYSTSRHGNRSNTDRSKRDASSHSSSWHGNDERSNRERPRRDGKSGKVIIKTLSQILQVVESLESKVDALETKIERLSRNILNNSPDSAYAIVTGSHITPKKNKLSPISSDNDMFDESDISDEDERGNDDDNFGVKDSFRWLDLTNDFSVFRASEIEFNQKPYDDHSETPKKESLRTKIPDRVPDKKAEVESEDKSIHQIQAYNGSANEGDEKISSAGIANNDEPPIDSDTKVTSASPQTSDEIMNLERMNTLNRVNADKDTPNGELLLLQKVENDETEDLHSTEIGKAASGSVNGSEFRSGPFTKQSMDDNRPEKHSESKNGLQLQGSNNQQMNESGLKNGQGTSDNRFKQEAHEMIPLMSVRSMNLSNSKWIKSGIWKTDVTNQKHQLRELLKQQTQASRTSTCMRSSGIDTVICLDTSASMAGRPLEIAKSVITDIIRGFEDNAIEHDLEENVAVVVFGKQNKIMNHLTNDYNIVLDELFQISAVGPSPLWVGLALALTEIKERGNIVTVGESNILPRIILITDGYASPKYILHGDDSKNDNVTEETKQEIVNFLETCRQFSRTIDCIQVGQCEQNMLQQLSGGRVYTHEDVEYLTQFFRVQDTADDLTKKIVSAEVTQIDVDQVIRNSDLTQKAQEDLKELIKDVKFAREEVEQHADSTVLDEKRPDPPGHEQSAEIVEIGSQLDLGNDKSTEKEFLKLSDELPEEPETVTIDDVKEPLFGASVTADESWTGYDTRQFLTGTVMGPRKKGMMKIIWSDGTMERCCYGVNGRYDFKIASDLFYSEGMHVGAVVERGPDWRWKDQDGGSGSIGVVTKLDEAVVHVTWSHSGVGNYRYGYNKKYDLRLCESRPIQRDQKFANQPRDNSQTPTEWQIQDKEGSWHSIEQEAAQSIEQMYSRNKAAQFIVNLKQISLRVSLENLEAMDLNTRQIYPIRRLDQDNKES